MPRDEDELGGVRLQCVQHLNVVDRGQDFLTVVLIVELGPGAVLQLHIEGVEEVHEVPLDLQLGYALAGTDRPEADERVRQLLPVLVELGVHEAVVLESLQAQKGGKEP